MTFRTTLVAAGVAAAATVPATAGAATLTTDLPCYLEQQPMTITGSGFTAGGSWSVSAEQLFDFGTADAAGNFVSTNETAPIIPKITTKPKTFTLTGKDGDAVVATTTFRVVNFLVKPASTNGKPTGTTRWNFSGFLPGKAIYFHVRKGGRTWTQKAGKGSAPCGTLKTRLRRLPAVPASQISFGTYKIAVDNRKRYTKGGRQYTASVSIYRTFG